jgi:hypothetical protein
VGAGINELTALAAVSEMAPTSKRGLYVGALIFSIIPFTPSVLYAQLIAYYGSWRLVLLQNIERALADYFMQILRPYLRHLGFRWHCLDRFILLPTTTRQL